MRVLAVDPGPTQSGWVILDAGRVADSGVHDNHDLLRWVEAGQGAQLLALEDMVAMGMPAGDDVLRTAKWLGRFAQAWDGRHGETVGRARFVPRRDVKSYLCGTQQAKDANIRRALLDIFPPTGGGSERAIGTKSKPGPLYGVSSHAWSALAVAITVCAKLRLVQAMPQMPQAELEAFA